MTGAGAAPAVELDGLAIGYRRRRRSVTVAAGLSARARRGELTVLIGPNGAGKSTLIRTLAGLQPALGGRVLLDGAELTALPRDELARRVAVVLTGRVDPGLLSARELVGLGRIPHLGLGARLRPADEEIVDWALAAAGAQHLAPRPAAELSDGECQRVLTARALAQQPGLLILDEPTAFLDVSSRAALFGLLRELAREQRMAVVLSTHDLELALRVADRVWLMDPAGTCVDTVGEELMLSGRIGEMFGNDTLRFDPGSGMFELDTRTGDRRVRTARVDAAEPLRSALYRVLAREGFGPPDHRDAPAEIVLTATESRAITVRTVNGDRDTALPDLARLLRSLPTTAHRCAPPDRTVAALNELAAVGTYFTLSAAGTAHWRPVAELYTDPELLSGLIARVRERIGASEFRVAASTFYLGYAARLWSIGLGAAAEHALLIDLDPGRLRYAECGGTIGLHLPEPLAWHGPGETPGRMSARVGEQILAGHLQPLAAAVRRLGPVSERLLLGNAAAAALGAAHALHRHHGGNLTDQLSWKLARHLVDDERLAGTLRFDDPTTDYRRTSCCLFYRTPGGGLCQDCALSHRPAARPPR
ncbi:ABC transporter [Mycolicibacter engbaekii]|uniref:ABC transporter n=1 Tax=Mycolicibacter engbaekii TaxID=188915 RepID=A0A1X1TXG3_9MYCO|nr:ATP-binding cassette domain-containing protein [Mycolicibacter engbaekii]ORV49237.1 ABC transporter [Mycolicibacter engbaekii]